MKFDRARRIPVLMYHKIGTPPEGVRNTRTWVSEKRFGFQMRLLHRMGFQTISPGDLYEYYQGRRPLNPRDILITFDDGSRTCYTRAFPVMKGLGFVGTVFVVGGELGGKAGWDKNPTAPEDVLLSVEELKTLKRDGWEIGSHTLTHARLTEVPIERAAEEIRVSREILEEKLSVIVRTFAYPYGSYAPEHLDLVGKAGYDISFTTNYPEQGFLAVRRENIHGEVNALRFLWRLARARRGFFKKIET